jgi:adenine deaminase
LRAKGFGTPEEIEVGGICMEFKATRYELIEVAQGKRSADIYLLGGTVINVYSGELLQQNIAIYKDRIAYVGESKSAIGSNTKIIDANGKYISPGYIETHAHPWIVYNPVSLTEKVLPLGTTTIVNDNLFFYLHMGPRGFKQMVFDLDHLPNNQLWLARIVSQADHPGEREWFNSKDVQNLLDLDHVIGTAEVTRWPLLYEGDPFVIDTVEYAKSIGKISDGHTAGASYEKLNAVVAAGVSACHEAITAQESLNRLRLGMWTTLRNSSLRPDLHELIKMITEGKVDTSRIMMTTDGPHPAFIEEQGFVDGLLREAVALGLPPIKAVQMATINAATYLGLGSYIGGIAPGLKADVVTLPDLVNFQPEHVISGGELVAEEGRLSTALPEINWAEYIVKEPFTISSSILSNPDFYRFPIANDSESIPVISFRIAVITKWKDINLPNKDGYADISGHSNLAYAALIDRNGQWVSRGILENFTDRLEGMASTYNTTTELLVIGRNPEAMAQAAMRVREMGGGVAIVEQGESILEIPLPVTGMMTPDPAFSKAVEYQNQLLECVKVRGYPFHDILYTLLFLTCDFLPGLRLVPNGLYDVKTNQVVEPSESILVKNV